MRPPKGSTQSPAKFVVGHRMRRCCIYRSCQLRSLDAMHDQPRHIVRVNPADPLLAAANPASDSKLIRQRHKRKRASIIPQHEADSQLYEPWSGYGVGCLLPFDNDTGEKISYPGGACLVIYIRLRGS